MYLPKITITKASWKIRKRKEALRLCIVALNAVGEAIDEVLPFISNEFFVYSKTTAKEKEKVKG